MDPASFKLNTDDAPQSTECIFIKGCHASALELLIEDLYLSSMRVPGASFLLLQFQLYWSTNTNPVKLSVNLQRLEQPEQTPQKYRESCKFSWIVFALYIVLPVKSHVTKTLVTDESRVPKVGTTLSPAKQSSAVTLFECIAYSPKAWKTRTVLENICPGKTKGCQGIKERVLISSFQIKMPGLAQAKKEQVRGNKGLIHGATEPNK